jgi:hypothetical protein
MADWYYKTDGEEHGPVDAKTLKDFAALGDIVPETPVSKGVDGKWVRAAKVKGLFAPKEPAEPSRKNELTDAIGDLLANEPPHAIPQATPQAVPQAQPQPPSHVESPPAPAAYPSQPAGAAVSANGKSSHARSMSPTILFLLLFVGVGVIGLFAWSYASNGTVAQPSVY